MPEISDMEILGAASGASKADRGSARRLLGMVADRLKHGSNLPPNVIEFLVDAFKRISGGESADLALGLKSQRMGRPRDPRKSTRDLFLAASLHFSLVDEPTFENAVTSVAEAHGVSESTVKQAYTSNRYIFDENI